MLFSFKKFVLCPLELCEEEDAEAASPDVEPGTEMDQGEPRQAY